MSVSSSSTPTIEYSKESVEAARQIFQSFDELHALDIPLAAKIIDRELKYPALLVSHRKLQEALEGAQEELRLIRMKDSNIVYDPTLKVRMSLALAKSREIINGK